MGLLWLRVLMGLGMMTHGYGKLFEPGRMERFTEGVASMGFPLPAFFAWAAALTEFFGGIFVVIGLATRPAAFLIFVTMFVAAFIRHGDDPFKVKELALAYWTMAGALVMMGGGPYSLDRFIWRKKDKEKQG